MIKLVRVTNPPTRRADWQEWGRICAIAEWGRDMWRSAPIGGCWLADQRGYGRFKDDPFDFYQWAREQSADRFHVTVI